jgi:hypothetical protein
MSELSITELQTQQGDLLPAREALNRGHVFVAIGSGNLTSIHSKATAIQVLTFGSSNSASSSVVVVNGVGNLNGGY